MQRHHYNCRSENYWTKYVTDQGNSPTSCQAHGLCTGDESEEAVWIHSYDLEWTAAAAAEHTDNAWTSPAHKHQRMRSQCVKATSPKLFWCIKAKLNVCLPRWGLLFLEEISWSFYRLADQLDLAGRMLTPHEQPAVVSVLKPWQYLQVWSIGLGGGQF